VCILGLLFFFLLSMLPADAADWSRHENRDLVQDSRPGWAIETPGDWLRIPDVRPAWPLGGGFRDPSGQLGVVITWLEEVPGGEIEGLLQRGFQEEPGRVAGHPARLFHRTGPEGIQRLVYLKMPSGYYRVTLFATAGHEEELGKVLNSFQLLRGQSLKEQETWTPHEDSQAGYSLSHPTRWVLRNVPQGFELHEGPAPVVRAWLRPVPETPGGSFRGFARSAGRTTIPEAISLERFEPLDVAGVTGYLAVWKLRDGSYHGPSVYLPLPGGRQALELVLLLQEADECFFRLVNSFRPGEPITASP
jgi:hypothetical protein